MPATEHTCDPTIDARAAYLDAIRTLGRVLATNPRNRQVRDAVLYAEWLLQIHLPSSID